MTPDARLAELAHLALAEGEASERTRAAIRALRSEGYSLRVLALAARVSPGTIRNICMTRCGTAANYARGCKCPECTASWDTHQEAKA